MSAGLYTALAVAAGLGAYALYRSNEGHGAVKTTVGAGNFVDYTNPADARSDHRPEAAYLIKPYQILNIGGGVRPMEIDAQGQPTGRELILPGEKQGAKNSVVVGAEHWFNYQNDRDAYTDHRPEAAYLVKPYQILNVGGGIRPMEVDAQGKETGRQLVLPGESPTVAHPAQYVLVGQSVAERRGGRRGHVGPAAIRSASAAEHGTLPSLGRAGGAGYHATHGEWGDGSEQSDYVVGVPLYNWKGPSPYNVNPYNPYGGGSAMNAAAMRRRMWLMRQRMQQQQLAAQQQALQDQLAQQQMMQDALQQQQLAATDDGSGAGLDDGLGGLGGLDAGLGGGF